MESPASPDWTVAPKPPALLGCSVLEGANRLLVNHDRFNIRVEWLSPVKRKYIDSFHQILQRSNPSCIETRVRRINNFITLLDCDYDTAFPQWFFKKFNTPLHIKITAMSIKFKNRNIIYILERSWPCYLVILLGDQLDSNIVSVLVFEDEILHVLWILNCPMDNARCTPTD